MSTDIDGAERGTHRHGPFPVSAGDASPVKARLVAWLASLPQPLHLALGIAVRFQRHLGGEFVGLAVAGVTFFLVLSFFPALAIFVSIYGLVTDVNSITSHMDVLTGFIPPEAITLMKSELTRVTAAGNTTLGLSIVVSFAVSVWSASNGVRSLFQAMNLIYGEHESRSFVRVIGLSLAFTFIGMAGTVFAFNLAIVAPWLLGAIGLGWLAAALQTVIAPVILLCIFTLVTAALYRWGPSREPSRWRWISLGSALAGLLWLALSSAFVAYLANFNTFSASYGSLGAFIGLMVWVYLSAYVVIMGAALNRATEEQTDALGTGVGEASTTAG